MTIYYTLFSVNQVFEDARLNVFFNQMFTFLINVFGEDRVINNLIIDGKISLLLQGGASTLKYSRIELSTNDIELYKYLLSSAKMLDIKGFKEKKQSIEFELKSGFFIYINYTLSEITILDYRGIKIRSKLDL